MRSSHRVLAVCAALVLLISSLQFLSSGGIKHAEASSFSSFSSSIGPTCGNSICEFPSESCDGGDFCGANCGSFGFTNGVVTCSMGCVIDTSGCYNGSSSSISSSSSSVGSSSSVSAPFFSWWSVPLLLAACVGGWKLMSAEKQD